MADRMIQRLLARYNRGRHRSRTPSPARRNASPQPLTAGPPSPRRPPDWQPASPRQDCRGRCEGFGCQEICRRAFSPGQDGGQADHGKHRHRKRENNSRGAKSHASAAGAPPTTATEIGWRALRRASTPKIARYGGSASQTLPQTQGTQGRGSLCRAFITPRSAPRTSNVR
jgi:hypothetical protein